MEFFNPEPFGFLVSTTAWQAASTTGALVSSSVEAGAETH